MAEHKKNITVTLYKSELIYDIENKTYLTGRSRVNGNNHEEVANMQANEDDENRNQILRSLGNALGVLKTKMSEYLNLTATTSTDALLTDGTETGGSNEITIALSMPSNYNLSTIDSITSACHQYFVNVATADWFVITNKADAADYANACNAAIEQLREAFNKRIRPVRTNPTTT